MGNLQNGKKITIGDVAEALGVSKTTVSRAISGKGRIGSETKERIMEYIELHQYRPSAIAKGLAQSRTYNIGLAVPEDFALVDLPFFQKCLMGVCEYASTMDYDVVISMTSLKNISQLERMVNNNKVDGVILTRTLIKDIPVEFLKSKGLPFVTIGSTDDTSIIQVDNDHMAACRELTSILLMQNIGKIVLLGGNPSHVVTQMRMKGFVEAMEAYGRPGWQELIFLDSNHGVIIDKIVEEQLARKVDCILCMDDSICVRVLDKLKKEGISVPHDIKVASFYNSSVLERNDPAITSLQFDARQLGRVACRTLLDVIEGREVLGRNLLGYEISMKESTKIF